MHQHANTHTYIHTYTPHTATPTHPTPTHPQTYIHTDIYNKHTWEAKTLYCSLMWWPSSYSFKIFKEGKTERIKQNLRRPSFIWDGYFHIHIHLHHLSRSWTGTSIGAHTLQTVPSIFSADNCQGWGQPNRVEGRGAWFAFDNTQLPSPPSLTD